ncbi:hypothetical protein N752_09260 [Desulforamulus aquiferis]|nr:hypothetical protein [Desulforamulus aquiferis]RYD05524.1 hypothetical protein N752_09260 [Desulforamulus aquiferis]
MRELTVVSGKGGTGKTSLLGALPPWQRVPLFVIVTWMPLTCT